MKLKRARTREEQSVRASTTKISKNPKEVSVMKLGGCRDKLAQNVNSMGDVRTSDPKVDETTNKMQVASRIGKRLTISGSQLNTKLHGCVNCAVIGESSTREDPECTSPGRGRCHQAWKKPRDQGSNEEDPDHTLRICH